MFSAREAVARAIVVITMVALGGCYRSHERAMDAGRDASADSGSPPHDAGEGCREGAPCDDGDACTLGDVCRGGACTGAPRSCETPPGACFAPLGVCRDGECAYAPAEEGTACDDGDACTLGDACSAGACAGAPLACDAPPPARCIDERTLRTFAGAGTCAEGACAYPSSDRTCPDGCAGGACVCVPVPWTLTDVPIDTWDSDTTEPFLATAPSGEVHLVYRGLERDSHLIHASGPPGGPLVPEVVPFPTEGRHVFVADAVLGGDVLHVLFVHDGPSGPGSNTLMYAARDAGGAWSFRTLDPAAGRGASLAIDDEGGLHVAYSKQGDAWSDLAYAYAPAGGAFATETIEFLGEVGMGPSIALDDRGGAHIASLAPPDGRVRYATRAAPGGTWAIENIETTHQWVGVRSTLVIDDGGTLHLGYTVGGRGFSYARRPPGGGWILDGVIAPGDRVMGELALDARGRLHVALTDRDRDEARHGVRDASGAWSFTTLESGRMDWTPSIALDREGGIHVAYFITGSAFTSPPVLRYAYRRECHE